MAHQLMDRTKKTSSTDVKTSEFQLQGISTLMQKMLQTPFGIMHCGCDNCKNTGHIAKDCRVKTPVVKPTVPTTKTCYVCGKTCHVKNHCPTKKKGNDQARGRAFNINAKDARDDSELVTGTFIINNVLTYILFNTRADRSYICRAFFSKMNCSLLPLDDNHIVELANGKLVKVNKICRNCKTLLTEETFEIDLIPVELGSFDVIVGMDWMSMMRAEIISNKKVIRFPRKNGLPSMVYGEKSNPKLNLISCINTRKFMRKGCHAILAHVKKNTTEEKSIDDVIIVKEISQSLSEGISRITPA
ncbi:uncharacterized protein [Rutidosis leptorrhynchoides]|uniref:uncharacterized protein n=1 Tax=Rutidosis leptorrhynchoides TaxID=125765 RepID=UPI003A9A0A1A